MNDTDTLAIDSVRVLSADAIQKARSGHPGLPLGAAPMAYELFAYKMNHNPADPKWPNRDRFILSAGHGSMLLYSLLHLFGYGLTIDDLKNFRQVGSVTPGHPEYGRTVGVEATTGPLGQGMGMAVGMAIAEKHLAAVFNKEDYPVVDHYTYVLAGDGCMMEGTTSEAMSLAGTLGLSKLIVLYDSNQISIEGDTDVVFTEDVAAHMRACGFQTILVDDGTDIDAIGRAIDEAKADTVHPSFITVRTRIGEGCPAKVGKASAHGEPLGEENVRELKENLGWDPDEYFYVPEEVYENCAKLMAENEETEAAWQVMFAAYCDEYPEMGELWEKYFGTPDVDALMNDPELWLTQDGEEATRTMSGKMLDRLKDIFPNLVGGSADLGPSNKTIMKDAGDFSASDPAGRNIHFGVREQAMTCIGNGLMLHGGLKAYVATFFVFSDYMKPMMRLSALMKVPLIYVFSHDSIGVGEDGPTHQPVEELAMLRAMPNFHSFRPADATETSAAWLAAITSKDTPTALILTRQNVEPVPGTSREALKGGYVLSDCEGTPDVILIASGSEVSIAVKAKAELEKDGTSVRVVSMPSTDVFDEQSAEYRESVLPDNVRKRVAIEAEIGYGWEKYVGLDGAVVSMNEFGTSGPYKELFPYFGFTAENVAYKVRSLLSIGK